MFAAYIVPNFVSLFSIVALFLFLRFNGMLEKSKRYRLYNTLVLCLLLVLVEIVEVWEQTFDTANFLHFVSTGLGYALRPLILLSIAYVTLDVSLKVKLFIALPAFVNAALSLLSIFVPIVFDFTEHNSYVSGPLKFVPIIVGIAYLAAYTVYTVILYHKKQRSNATIFLVIFAALTAAFVTEWINGDYRVLTATIVFSVVIFYVYLLTVNYRKDPLTGALNRTVLYLDVADRFAKLTGMILIDLNRLKVLNDTEGHLAGDTALISIADSCNMSLSDGAYLYRFGGDEFLVLVFGKERDAVREIEAKIRQTVKETPYRAALGIAFHDPNDTFDSMLGRADVDMYADKQRIKAEGDLQQGL